MNFDDNTRRVLLIVAVVLGYAFSITVGHRGLKRAGFIFSSAALFYALIQASGGDGLVRTLYRWMRGEESWLPTVIVGNAPLFTAYFAPLSDLALLFGAIAGLFAALALLDVKLFNQVARVALVALLAAFVGGLATVRVLSAGFGGYGGHDVFFGRPSERDILDGDTFKLGPEFGAVDIRLFGIDAPEYHQAQTHEDGSSKFQRCFALGKLVNCGEQARTALIAIVKDQRIVCTKRGRDPYGRVLASCVIPGTSGLDRDISEEMAAKGNATAFRDQDGKEDPTYQAAISKAKSQSLGLWSMCTIWPDLWRKDDEKALRIQFEQAPRSVDPGALVDKEACDRAMNARAPARP